MIAQNFSFPIPAAVAFAVLFTAASPVSAQPPGTVQLPAVGTFQYGGSVLVPDRGTASLGGVSRRSASARKRSGGRSSSVATQAGGLSVSAKIIDHHAIDRQILGGDPRSVRDAQAAAMRHRDVPPADAMEESKVLVRHARKLVAAGDRAAARDTYRVAMARLHRVSQSATSVRRRRTAAKLLAYAKREYAGRFSRAGIDAPPSRGPRTARR